MTAEDRDKELAELDYEVAIAEGHRARLRQEIGFDNLVWACRIHDRHQREGIVYRPTADRGEAMRLLEKYRLSLTWHQKLDRDGHHWKVTWARPGGELLPSATGETPMEAVCRAVVRQ